MTMEATPMEAVTTRSVCPEEGPLFFLRSEVSDELRLSDRSQGGESASLTVSTSSGE
jgi:hypothetical protein